MALIVLSVVGSDRPGLTQTLAAAVLAAGGNWLESHLSQLGGLYVGSVLVALDADAVEGLRSAIGAVDTHGLEVRIAPATGADAPHANTPDGDAFTFSLVGQDQAGIVNQVTTVLSRFGANIESFKSWIVAEPHSGAPLFHVDARLRLPGGLNASDLQAALEDISAEIMVDVALRPAP